MIGSVGLDVGIVGRLQVAAGGPGDTERQGDRERHPFDRLPRRAQPGFWL